MASTENSPTVSRPASWIGGIALLLIAILAGIGNFAALTPLIAIGDAAATVQNISGAELQFRLGVLAMLATAILDVVVAAALYSLLAPVNHMVAITAAWFRVAYSAIFLVAIAQLATVPGLVDQPEVAMNALDSYFIVWRTGLTLFGVHLLLVGYLAYRSRFIPRALAVLIAIAGAGYFVDGIGTVLIANFTPTISTFTFVGEVLLIVWLIVLAIRPARFSK